MNQTAQFNTPIQNIFYSTENTYLKDFLLIFAGVIVLAFASQLSIPLRPIPLTFQSVTVVLIAMAYGARNGSLVVMAYLLAGICGLPVFADFSYGIPKLMGPSMGYLLGFLPAAFVSGYLAQRGFGRHVLSSFLTACLGVAIIFACGVPVLATFIGFKSAIALGLMPFMFTEAIKLGAVALVIPRLWASR